MDFAGGKPIGMMKGLNVLKKLSKIKVKVKRKPPS